MAAEKDGVRYMTAPDLLAALIPTYPASQSSVERAGHLDGRSQLDHSTQL